MISFNINLLFNTRKANSLRRKVALAELNTGFKISIYIARDETFVFYIGISEDDVIDRLQTHLGIGAWNWTQNKSEFGKFVHFNKPSSNEWKVDLLSPVECSEYLAIRGCDVGSTAILSASEAESILIGKLHPAINRSKNTEPMNLPSQFVLPGIDENSVNTMRDHLRRFGLSPQDALNRRTGSSDNE